MDRYNFKVQMGTGAFQYEVEPVKDLNGKYLKFEDFAYFVAALEQETQARITRALYERDQTARAFVSQKRATNEKTGG